MDKNRIAGVLQNVVGIKNVRIDEPMRNHTSFKVGGPADILLTPDSVGNLCKVMKIIKEENIPFFVMGNGTNLVIRDKGIRGVVVKLFENFNKCDVKDNIITAEAGVLLSRVSRLALKHELAGLEFAEGIPGTLGGAVAMNAGAYGGEMKDVVIRTEYMDINGEVKTLQSEEHQFSHRTSFIQREEGIVLRSELKLRPGKKEEIKELMDDFGKRRKDKQPLELPSAGSIFKRPEGFFAGKLVEDCGLKGCRIGGAEVSTKHSGFIVNVERASAQDVLQLIRHIQQVVSDKFGVELQTEVRIVGEE